MNLTKHYELLQPDSFDYFDICHFNQNTDTIDLTMHKFQYLVDEMIEDMEEIKANNINVEEHIERLDSLLEEAKELNENGVWTVNNKSGNHIVLDYADVGAVPISRTINGHALNADIVLKQSDIDMTQLETAISTAQNSADTAKSAADTAQGTANTAKSAADTAQGTANTAKSAADTAQGTANTAKTAAEAAQKTANTANTTANNAMPKAGGTFSGVAVAGGTQAVGTAQIRNIRASTTDLTAGSSSLPTGQLYLVYE